MLQDTKFVFNINGLKVDFYNMNTCDYYKVNNGMELSMKMNELEKYKTEETRYINVEFKEVKIFRLYFEEKKESTSAPCGFATSFSNYDGYYSSFSIAYNEGNNFGDVDYIRLFCTIELCELGLMFFDKYKNVDVLNNIHKVHMVEYAVLLVLQSSNNKLLMNNQPYHEVNIRLGLCPYINWIHKKGWIKYIPVDHIIDNGFFEEENGYGHIVVPYYYKNDDVGAFICGTLKQPSLPDLLVGIKLYNYTGYTGVIGEIDPLNEELKCQSSDNPHYHYHFGYLEKDTNYMSERIMEAINVRDKDSKYKFYAGQKVYIYKWDNIKDGIKNRNSILRLKNPFVFEDVSCIKNLKSDIQANILPTIGSVDSIQKHQKKNLFYRLIKSDEFYRKFSFKCLSKVEGLNKAHMDEFYSRSAVFSIKNEEKPNIIYTSTKNEIIFDRKNIENYGSYRCKESRVTRVFNKNVVTMDKVYYLPDENSELPLEDLKNSNKQYIGCIKQYESLGEIKKIRIEFGENVREPMDIDNFNTGNDKIDMKENLIIYKTPKDVPGVIVKCIYQTPADTTFYTKREIHFHIIGGTEAINDTRLNEMKKNIVTQGGCNTTAWIIGIVVTVVLFCIIMIILINVLVRKTEKEKLGNSSSMSLSSSKSSNRSKSGNNGSSGMGGVRNTTAGRRRNTYKSTVLKTSKNEKDSKSFTSSGGGTRNSTSSNFSKNYAKNFNLVAK
uniref:C2H2-type domain-containing protein n=1 Tax=Strongyloides papillosus TaxID=174720 RepID=A0A0N5BTH7_STREA